MNLQVAVDKFIDHLQMRSLSAETVRNYQQDLQTLGKWLGNRSLDSAWLGEYLIALHKRYQRKSIARHLSTLRSWCAFLHKRGYLTTNPMAKVARIKLHHTLPAVISPADMLSLLEQPDISTRLGLRDRAIIELLYSSALRVSELTALDRDHLFEEEIWVQGKGKKERVVPLTATAKRWLDRYLARQRGESKALFHNCHGSRMSSRAVEGMVARYARQAKIESPVTPHTIRHTIATHWLERGMSIRIIQELLGHRSLATTMIYTQVSISLKQQALQLHPLHGNLLGNNSQAGERRTANGLDG